MKFENRLSIADGQIGFNQVTNEDGTLEDGFEVITSFKTIYENTYTVIITNKKDNQFKMEFKYIDYQPWESPIKGFLNEHNQDFIILSKDGMNFIRLDDKLLRRSIQRKNQCKKMVHSLSSMNYLKVEEGNMLLFQRTNESRKVAIQHCNVDDNNNSSFEQIYEV
jgi:hypothetical protein